MLRKLRKSHILFFICVFGFALCLTNGFAIPEGDFDFPTAEGAAYIQAPPEFQRVPENIIGTNDFEKMRNLPHDSQDYQLGTKVGWIVIPQRLNPNRGWICTGFLVGPDLFMTNHHCIHDEDGLLQVEGSRIYMDYYQERDVDPTFGGVTARVTEILRMDELKDYALLRLDSPIGDTYGWLELDTTPRVDASQSVKLISHPRGRSKEIVRRNTEIVELPTAFTDVLPFLFAYLADSEPGSSGSPVFLRDGTDVIAIHHSAWSNRFTGEPVFNAGSLMAYIVPEIQQWLPDPNASDLVIGAPQVNKDNLRPGESFTLSTTVRNKGSATSPTTLWRVYQSLDNTITKSDVEVGRALVNALTPFETTQVEITLPAPIASGVYYGTCVDAVDNENKTDNNCSSAVKITLLTPVTAPSVYMYWTDAGTDKIQRANLDGTNREDLVTGLDLPRGLAVDMSGDKMYWADAGTDKIQRANLDGTNREDLVTGLQEPDGIALDVAGNKIYWTDRAAGHIQWANLDGTNVENVATGLTTPAGLALDVAGNKIYWTDIGAAKIQRANLDGSNIEDLVSGLILPSGLALDVAGNKIYWTDIGAAKIQRANLDGSNVQDIVTRLLDPPGLALDTAGNKIYWTEWGFAKIQRANLDGTHVEDLTIGLMDPFGIALGIETAPPPSGFTFHPGTIADQRYPVNTRITPLVLPVATGGTPPYTYTLSPLPAGLNFTAATRLLSGTPTTASTTDVTYTATDDTGESATLTFKIEVIGDDPSPDPDPLDVNRDGRVTVIDLAIVAMFYGTQVPAGVSFPADVNTDGSVDLADLTAVAQGIDAAGANLGELSLETVEAALVAAAEQAAELEDAAEAPMRFNHRDGTLPLRDVLSEGSAYRNVANALAEAGHLGHKVPEVLQGLLQLLREMGTIPEASALLPNYPNPFNPETWIPYQLAEPAEITLSIYSVDGRLVRMLDLGHQAAGVYESRGRAAYWDGRNESGEPVASGVYFYTLTAGEFTATRKLLIAK